MSALEHQGSIVEFTLSYLLFRGGRANFGALVREIVSAGDPRMVALTRSALDLGEKSGLFVLLGHDLILCQRGWGAIASGAPPIGS